MSSSTCSIFERHVELLEPSLNANQAIQLAVPPVLDQAIEALSSNPQHILVDRRPFPLHLSPLPIDPMSSSLPLAPDSPPSPSLPALHRHCPSDSDPSSPRSLSPSPSIRPPLTASPSAPHSPPSGHPRKLCLSFMSYVDVINAERAEDQEPSLSALARLRLARASTRSLTTSPASFLDPAPGPARPFSLGRLGNAWISPPASQPLAKHPSPGSAKSPATTPAPDDEAEVLSDLEWNSC